MSSNILYNVGNTFLNISDNIDFENFLLWKSGKDQKLFCRVWSTQTSAIILGRGDKVYDTVSVENCKKYDVKICRRISGGSTVLLNKDVLCYSLIIPEKVKKTLKVDDLFELLLTCVIKAVQQIDINLTRSGISDLSIGNCKVSGNAQAVGWGANLVHGTLILNDIGSELDLFLSSPRLPPAYRNGRKHSKFVTSLKMNIKNIDSCIIGDDIIDQLAKTLNSSIKIADDLTYEFSEWKKSNRIRSSIL